MRSQPHVTLILMVAATAAFAACSPSSTSAAPAPCPAGVAPSAPTAELFATTNTAVISDPADPRLRDTLSGMPTDVDATVVRNAALPLDSTLTNGVFWSDDRHETTYEPSRMFRLACTDDTELHDIAQQVRNEYHQESVLTFTFLDADQSGKTAVNVEAPRGDVTRLHDALVADPDMQSRLVGGSVTQDHQLIVVADVTDLDLVERLVKQTGADWSGATVRYGKREFVGSDG